MRQTKIPLKTFYYIRHGETDWNRQNRAMGQEDISLNERGLEQAQEVTDILSQINYFSIISSPLHRAHQTAKIIAKAHYGMPVHICKDLQEACWGELQGKNKGNGEQFRQWRNNHLFEGAELYSDFTTRIFKALGHVLNRFERPLIVSHGAVFWCIQEALGVPVSDLPNCTIAELIPPLSQNQKWSLTLLGNEDQWDAF